MHFKYIIYYYYMNVYIYILFLGEKGLPGRPGLPAPASILVYITIYFAYITEI